jgi:hypothetical protein
MRCSTRGTSELGASAGAGGSWQPETYADMGAAVPVTAPELTGARARRSKAGIELTLPNPSGRRGVYILDPKEMTRFCVPSLHDRELVGRMTALPCITPSSIRLLAREVAEAGYAGRDAATAARSARAETRRADLAAQLHILRLLVAQMGGGDTDPVAMDRAAKSAIATLAERTGQQVASIMQAIDRASRLAAVTGLAPGQNGRHAALVSDLATMLDSVRNAAGAEAGRAARAASLLLSAGSDTAALVEKALGLAWHYLADIPALLAAYAAQNAAVLALPDRLDWLLDGWAAICHVWHGAPPGRNAATLNEIGLMVPLIPAEAGAWYGVSVSEAARQSLRAEIVGFTDWRSFGLSHDLLTRNEALRAQMA